jgi:hypothetical protein
VAWISAAAAAAVEATCLSAAVPELLELLVPYQFRRAPVLQPILLVGVSVLSRALQPDRLAAQSMLEVVLVKLVVMSAFPLGSAMLMPVAN